MGSTPHAQAVAIVPSPHFQGTVAMIGVFIDTAIVLTMTGLIIVSTIYTGNGPLANATGDTYAEILKNSGLTQTNLVQHAIASVSSMPVGNIFVAICLLFFAFSTILGWNFFGKINTHYLFGKKATAAYSFLAVGFIFLGSIVKSDLAWALQDMFNQLMVLPNVITLFALSGIAAAAASRKKQ
jgi:AGCS family alanine or glycine:cation symporter